MANKIQIRRDTASNWTSSNPTLSQGEQGYETDTGKLKIGNGSTAWTSLGYSFEGGDPDLYADNYDGTATKPNASASNSVALGKNAVSGGGSSIAFGASASSAGNLSSAIGFNAAVGSSGSYAAAIGQAYAGGIDSFAAQIGSNSSSYGATGNNATAVGILTKATGLDFVFGKSSIASGGSGSLSLGMDNTSSGGGAVTLGKGNTASHTDAVVIGQGASSSAADQITLGHTDQTVRISSAYTLPTSDGTNGQVLTTNGSGTVTFATASGGGADLYAANPVSATNPTAQGDNSIAIGSGANDGSSGYDNAIAIGTSALAEAARSVSIGKSTNSGTDGVGIGTNAHGGGSTATAVGAHTDARSVYATALGAWAQAWTGWGATAIAKSYASGTDSLAAVITNNTSSYGATGAYSIAGGYLNKATASDTLCWGGDSNLVTNGQAAVVGGWMNQAEGGYSFIGGGRNNRALATYSRAGGHDADTNDNHGKDVWASGDFSSRGDAQTAKRVLRSDTTDATAEALTSINGSPNTTNQVVLPNNSAYFFTGTCVARQQAADGTDVGAWEFKGAIRREANAGTTTLIKSTIDEFNVPTGWALALSADTTNGCLKIEVTGAASTNIRWVATVHTSEVTYA